MRPFHVFERPPLERVGGPDADDSNGKPDDPLLDILRVMLGMFAVFAAVWLTILLLTLGK